MSHVRCLFPYHSGQLRETSFLRERGIEFELLRYWKQRCNSHVNSLGVSMEGAEIERNLIGGDGQILVQDRLQGKSLRVLSKTLVAPVSQTASENEWLQFCQLDWQWSNFYTPLICIYKPAPEVANDGVVEHLKKSLSEALVLFYPLAGRLMKAGRGGIRCNDAGAVFVEAEIDAELRDLEYDDFQPAPLLSGMAEAGLGSYPTLPQIETGLPTLCVQVTRFKCGGLTLAANWAHGVGDGFSGFHFMKSWAEISRGSQVSLLPYHHRSAIKPRNPPLKHDPWAISSLQPNLQESSVGQQQQLHEEEEENSKVIVEVVKFTKDDIDQIKHAVLEGTTGEPRLSTVDCVSAYLWRTILAARELPETDLVRSWTLVEGRKILSLPPGYCGNVLLSGFAESTVGNILHNPLSHAAKLIHSTVKVAQDKQTFLDYVDWMELNERMVFPGSTYGADHESGFSWQTRLPFYELDFGFGVPVCSMRNVVAAWDGFIAILPSAGSSQGYAAMVHLAPDVMRRFLPLVHGIRKI